MIFSIKNITIYFVIISVLGGILYIIFSTCGEYNSKNPSKTEMENEKTTCANNSQRLLRSYFRHMEFLNSEIGKRKTFSLLKFVARYTANACCRK